MCSDLTHFKLFDYSREITLTIWFNLEKFDNFKFVIYYSPEIQFLLRVQEVSNFMLLHYFY